MPCLVTICNKIIMSDQYERIVEESRQLASRMRSNPGSTQMAQEQLVFCMLKMLPLITWMVDIKLFSLIALSKRLRQL